MHRKFPKKVTYACQYERANMWECILFIERDPESIIGFELSGNI